MCKYWVASNPKCFNSDKKIDDFVKEVTKDRLSNPDGSGFYFYDGKRYHVHKYYPKTPDSMIESELTEYLKNFNKGSLIIYHNRYSTSGQVTKSQCHPIPIEHCDETGENIYKGWFVIHNGILPDYEIEGGVKNLSDTQIVARMLGQWMYDHNIQSPQDFGNKRWKEFWETEFEGSKVTIVYKDDYYTINAKLGVYEDSMWKSCMTSVVTVLDSTAGINPCDCDAMTEQEKKWLRDNGYERYIYEDEKVDTSVPDWDPTQDR